MSQPTGLASTLPLRNVPLLGAFGGASLVFLGVLGPVSLWLTGASGDGDRLAMLVGGPVFVLMGLYVLYRTWHSWTVLEGGDEGLLWRGGRRRLRFPPGAVTGLTVDHGYARRRPFLPATILLHLQGPDLPEAVQIGRYRFAGAGLLQRTYRLGQALDVPVADPTGYRQRTRFPLPLRWLGEGRDWMAFLLVFGLVGPLFTLLTGNLGLILGAFGVGILVSLSTLVLGLRPLDLGSSP